MDGRTFPLSSPALGIRLVGGPEQYYLPGDTIHGAICREDHLVAPRARLNLSLQGRSKSHAADTANARNELYHTLEFKFFRDSDTTRVLYDGPAHIERGSSAMWPFEITIPLAASPVALARSGGQKSSYHAFSSEDPASLALPPSFDGVNVGLFDFGYAFVEYVLTAELHVFSQKSNQVVEARQPIELKSGSVVRPVEDCRLQTTTLAWCVSSYRLMPGMQGAGLSLSQQARRLFHSSKIPSFSCNVTVEMPTIIQLENPTPIPFLIRACPRWGQTSEIIRDFPQQINLRGVCLELEVITEVKTMGSVIAYYGVGRKKADLDVTAVLNTLPIEIRIPCGPDESPLDFGRMMGLRINRHGRMGQKKQSPCQITPTSTGLNIKRTYRLHWTVKLSIADEKSKFSGSQDIVILPPISAGQARAHGLRDAEPEIEAAPPPFVEAEDLRSVNGANDEAPPEFSEAIRENELSIGRE